MPKKAEPKSSLEGWSEVIREQGRESREREKTRKELAAQLLEAAAKLPLKEQMTILFTGIETGTLDTREFFQAGRKALDLPDLE